VCFLSVRPRRLFGGVRLKKIRKEAVNLLRILLGSHSFGGGRVRGVLPVILGIGEKNRSPPFLRGKGREVRITRL